MSQWPMLPLTQVLQLQRRWIKTHPTETYQEIGIRSFGKGIFHKAPVDGSILGNKRVLHIQPGDLVFNNVFAWEGAVAVAGPEEAGMIGSHRFVTYTVNPEKSTAQFLKLYFTTKPGLETLIRASPGSAGRNKTLGLDRFIAQSVPLPPLAEQRRLVERIDALAAKIEEAKALQRQVDHGVEEVCRSILRSSKDGPCHPTPMKELVRLREPDVTVQTDETYHFAGVYCFGGGVFVGQRKTGMEFKYTRLTRLKRANFVYPKLMAWEGALGIVPPECDGLVVSTEFPVFEIDEQRVLPELLDVYYRAPSVWPELSGASTGTNVRRRRLNPADFLRYEFPLPPMKTQLRVREVMQRVEEVRRYREPAAKELAAMLPAILDRAFRGEL